ncbi:MAG: 3-oxo-tetronate kinase [Burkholderiaceae bacterium]
MLLGCIADDFTGATDLANMLVRGGLRTLLAIGVPAHGAGIDADAVVVALKSRTEPADDAVAHSLAALAWLRAAGARQFFFKYCSTFDSTERGNIGPVADALMRALGTDFSIACPAFPENGRSVYRGHLFVQDALLSESGMEKHPLTPMTDANLVRVLARQTARRVGLARFDAVAAGVAALAGRFEALRREGVEIAIVDALSDDDLFTIGAACASMPLLTGGSGVAIGLPRNFAAQGLLADAGSASRLPRVDGPALVISGSCSKATNAQVAHWCASRPALRIDPLALAADPAAVERAIAWAREHVRAGPVMVYATSAPEDVARAQAALGTQRAGELVERALAALARALVDDGVRRLVVAGGETSGAVVGALGVDRLRVGPQIDPGVPWMLAGDGRFASAPLALALKSGNFGTPDFFAKSLAMLDEARHP